jgi:YebC/PmpR family DNA-binding regulatory protein
MSGHSKWATIKRHKGKIDEQRGKVFTKLGREIFVAVREGGANPDGNIRLRIAIQKARDANMPMDHIQRSIAKASGELEGVNYEELLYEGYGPGGVAILVEILTDNKKRSAADIRFIFSRNGGSLGEAGCVNWLFDAKGLVLFDKEDPAVSEDALTMIALEAGAEDVRDEGDSWTVITEPASFEAVKAAFEAQGIPMAHNEMTRLPRNTVPVTGEDAETLARLIELLEDNDDVQNVYANDDPGE